MAHEFTSHFNCSIIYYKVFFEIVNALTLNLRFKHLNIAKQFNASVINE